MHRACGMVWGWIANEKIKWCKFMTFIFMKFSIVDWIQRMMNTLILFEMGMCAAVVFMCCIVSVRIFIFHIEEMKSIELGVNRIWSEISILAKISGRVLLEWNFSTIVNFFTRMLLIHRIIKDSSTWCGKFFFYDAKYFVAFDVLRNHLVSCYYAPRLIGQVELLKYFAKMLLN